MEEYKIIEGFENYSVSKHGNVKNNKTGMTLKPGLNWNGYYRIDLYKSGKRKTFLVHRLVGNAFIPNPENKPQIDHIDNDRTNNNVNNLRWCTNQENNQNKGFSKNNTSGVKGVYFKKEIGKWCAKITHNGKKYHLGYFENIEDGSKARQTKAKELFGEFMNTIELEININNIKPNTKLKLNININNDEQKEIEELEREFEELIK
jgi:hypothetical protein